METTSPLKPKPCPCCGNPAKNLYVGVMSFMSYGVECKNIHNFVHEAVGQAILRKHKDNVEEILNDPSLRGCGLIMTREMPSEWPEELKEMPGEGTDQLKEWTLTKAIEAWNKRTSK
jgi:hypothetical protein